LCASESHHAAADAQLSQLAALGSTAAATTHELLCEPLSPASPAHTLKSIRPATACDGTRKQRYVASVVSGTAMWPHWCARARACPGRVGVSDFLSRPHCVGGHMEKSQSQVHLEFDGSLLARGRHRLTSLSSSLSARHVSTHTHLSAAGHRSLSSDRTVAHQLLLSAGARLSCVRCGCDTQPAHRRGGERQERETLSGQKGVLQNIVLVVTAGHGADDADPTCRRGACWALPPREDGLLWPTPPPVDIVHFV
jgi:hypothetical protein